MTSARLNLLFNLAVSICGLTLPLPGLALSADISIPTARQLVTEARALCPEANEENTLPRTAIAVALGYLGEIKDARSILDAHENDLSIDTAHDHLDEIEIRRTGKEPPLRP